MRVMKSREALYLSESSIFYSLLSENSMSENHPVKLFYSYSHKDMELCDELETHLKSLHDLGVISTWYDRKIELGAKWEKSIEDNLNAADIILLLISANFLSSDSCKKEKEQAMKRYGTGEVKVIPISLEPCHPDGQDFMELQGLPSDFKPVTTWNNRNQAFAEIAKGIREAAESIAAKKKL